MIVCEIQATQRSPQLLIHVNTSYALYQWLRSQARALPSQNDTRVSSILDRMSETIRTDDLHGVWQTWERALASGANRDDSLEAFHQAVISTGDGVIRAMQEAEAVFYAEVWPRQQPSIQAALATIEHRLAPVFSVMAAKHGELLQLTWPKSIDVYLVPECYERGGAYSHPLTVGVVENTNLTLCETLLHEATHVADVHAHTVGADSLAKRVSAYLAGAALDDRTRFNLWHAVIFASSASRIRHDLDSTHTDYAHSHGLYHWFGAPHIPQTWRIFEEARDEEMFRRSLVNPIR